MYTNFEKSDSKNFHLIHSDFLYPARPSRPSKYRRPLSESDSLNRLYDLLLLFLQPVHGIPSFYCRIKDNDTAKSKK